MAEPQVAAAHYDWSDYHSKARWASYWHQVSEVLNTRATSCLEVGTGSGVVKQTLIGAGVDTVSVDFAEDLAPDLVGDVRDLPVGDASYDVVLASQVLEHIPWDDVPKAVSEIRRVCRTHAVLSLPQAGWGVGIVASAHALGFFNQQGTSLIAGLPWRHRFDGQHHWEVGARGTRQATVRNVLATGFAVVREYTVPEMPYHRFYVLRKL